MKKIFVLVIFNLCISCNFFIDDVYSYIPKGTKLSTDILKKSSQIMINEKDIILLYDISKNQEDDDRAYHLLFFNRKSLTLYSATYFQSNFINTFENSHIMAYKDAFKESKKHLYRNDLPSNYKLNYYNHNQIYGTKIRANGIIESLNITKETELKINVRRADNEYILKGKYLLDKEMIEKFYEEESVQVMLSKIIFTYGKKKISIINTESNNELLVDGLAVPKINILNNFYVDLLESLKAK